MMELFQLVGQCLLNLTQHTQIEVQDTTTLMEHHGVHNLPLDLKIQE